MKFLTYVIITLCMLNYVWTVCGDITPSKSSDCTDYELTEEDYELIEEEEELEADSCCYQSVTMGGSTMSFCTYALKSMVNQINEEMQGSDGVDNFILECKLDSDSGSGSGSGSIWLSLSLTFLLFGLLF